MMLMVHQRGMPLVLAVVLGFGCGAPASRTVENRGGSAAPITRMCTLRPVLEVAARRYFNLDADDPGYQRWTPARVQLALTGERSVSGKLVMTVDKFHLDLRVTGRFDRTRCELTLAAETHDPVTLKVRFSGATTTGEIHSIDEVWLLGPPFPVRR